MEINKDHLELRIDESWVPADEFSKVFKDFWMRRKVAAVSQLDFDIKQGEVFGLIGPNGSGKSTTIKMILGLLHKTGGRLAVFGKTPENVSVKKRIGYLPEESYLYPFLNARETLDFYGKLFGLDSKARKKRTDELLEMVGLDAVQFRPIGEYSKGMQRRIGIAQALINDPDFLILDEPTSGLDPIGIRQVKDLILHLGHRGKTILLSSHLLSDVEDVCDYMVVLYGGQKQREGNSDSLLTAHDRTVIETEALDPAAVEAVRRFISEQESKKVLSISPARQSLESLFLEIVDQAQQQRVETFGAKSGGQTADFLREHEEAGGEGESEALLDRLVQPDEPKPTTAGLDSAGVVVAESDAVTRSAVGEGSVAETGVDAGVLDALSADGGAPTPDTPVKSVPPVSPKDEKRSSILGKSGQSGVAAGVLDSLVEAYGDGEDAGSDESHDEAAPGSDSPDDDAK